MGTGHLTPQFARGVRTDYGTLGVQWHVQGECESFFRSEVGKRVRLRTGIYDLTFGTTPSLTVTGVQVDEGQDAKVEIPAPGSLVLQATTSGYAVVMDAQTLTPILQFDASDLAGMHTLQPGDYTVVFRARNARGTLYSIQKNFTVASGSTTTIKLHG
jgi:Ca-activated chloride channel family protein